MPNKSRSKSAIFTSALILFWWCSRSLKFFVDGSWKAAYLCVLQTKWLVKVVGTSSNCTDDSESAPQKVKCIWGGRKFTIAAFSPSHCLNQHRQKPNLFIKNGRKSTVSILRLLKSKRLTRHLFCPMKSDLAHRSAWSYSCSMGCLNVAKAWSKTVGTSTQCRHYSATSQ